MLPLGIPQSNVQQELQTLIRGIVNVTYILEVVFPLGHSAREYLRSPVWISKRGLTEEPKESKVEKMSSVQHHLKRNINSHGSLHQLSPIRELLPLVHL
jgi:hypothetical protein